MEWKKKEEMRQKEKYRNGSDDCRNWAPAIRDQYAEWQIHLVQLKETKKGIIKRFVEVERYSMSFSLFF